MNFNLYLDDASARRLDSLAKRTGTPRNALVRKAVEEWLNTQASTWPAEVLEFAGDPAFAPFESSRSELRPDEEPPFLASVPAAAAARGPLRRRRTKR